MRPNVITQQHQDSSQRSYTDPLEQVIERKGNPRYFRATNNHSRKLSQCSTKSLPLTCSSWSSNSENKQSRAESRLKEILEEMKNDSKDFSLKDWETRGEEPYELVTQDDVPRLVWCAFCKAETSTYFVYANSSATFVNSVMICVFGGMLGCCLLPYFSNSCKETKTACRKCNHLISEMNE